MGSDRLVGGERRVAHLVVPCGKVSAVGARAAVSKVAKAFDVDMDRIAGAGAAAAPPAGVGGITFTVGQLEAMPGSSRRTIPKVFFPVSLRDAPTR